VKTEHLTCRYPRGAVYRDYAYAVAGAVLTLGPLGLTTPLVPITVILATLGALFVIFGVRTFVRQNMVVKVSDKNLVASGLRPANMAWEDLRELRLGYFTTKRDGRGGWMQLRLKHAGGTLRFDSSLTGFDALVAAAARAARRSGLGFEPATAENLQAMGLLNMDADAEASADADRSAGA